MRNKCLLGLGLVFVISLTSMVAFAFSFTGTPADEVDETEMIVRAVVSEEADAMPTTEPITTKHSGRCWKYGDYKDLKYKRVRR